MSIPKIVHKFYCANYRALPSALFLIYQFYLLSQARASEALIERVPKAILAFEEAFHSLEPRQQKAFLQTILRSAHIYKDGKIELEFREQSG